MTDSKVVLKKWLLINEFLTFGFTWKPSLQTFHVENFKFLYSLKACLAIANVASLCASVLGSLTTLTEPCVTKLNSFAASSSLIQASNGKRSSPIWSLERPLQQQLEIVHWKALEDFPSPWDSGGTFISRMKWFSIHYDSQPPTTTACSCWSTYFNSWRW